MGHFAYVCCAAKLILGACAIDNVNLFTFPGMGCPAGKAVRITDVFYGLRDSAGSATCASTAAQDTIDDYCDGKPTCYVGGFDVYMATVPAARNPNGQTCSGNDARLEIQFTCVAPTSFVSDVDFIQAMGDQYEECEVGHHRSEQLLGRRTPLIAVRCRGPWCTQDLDVVVIADRLSVHMRCARCPSRHDDASPPRSFDPTASHALARLVCEGRQRPALRRLEHRNVAQRGV